MTKKTRMRDNKEDEGQQQGRGTRTWTMRDRGMNTMIVNCKISLFYVLSTIVVFGLRRIYFFSVNP